MCVLNLVRLKHTLKQAKIKIDLSLWKTLIVHGKFLESHGICRAQKGMEQKHGKILLLLEYTFITYCLQTKVDC